MGVLDLGENKGEEPVPEGFIRVYCLRFACQNYLDVKKEFLTDGRRDFKEWQCGQCGWLNRLV